MDELDPKQVHEEARTLRRQSQSERVRSYYTRIESAKRFVCDAAGRYRSGHAADGESLRARAEREYAELVRLLHEPHHREHMSDKQVSEIEVHLRELRHDLDEVAALRPMR
jgi:predicted HD phosphohydrolase